MRTPTWKKVGVFTIGALLLLAVFMSENNVEKKPRALRVAFPAIKSVTAYEPTRIYIDHEYIFLESIFSPLVEFDQNGILLPGVAEKAYWRGDELHFEIRDNLTTANGTPITAKDAEFSLKRVLVLSGNTHGNLNDILCPGTTLKSVDTPCDRLRVDGNTLILRPSGSKYFILPMLAAVDFVVIPRSSVDPKTLAITDYQQTSGPYFVSQDGGSGKIELSVNKYHYHFSEKIPAVIHLIPIVSTTPAESLKELEAGNIDHITTIDANTRSYSALPFASANDRYDLHTTLKFNQSFLTFNEKGLKETTWAERKYIGEKVKLALKSIYGAYPEVSEASQFFPAIGSGGLSAKQQSDLLLTNSKPAVPPKKPIALAFTRKLPADKIEAALKTELPDGNFFKEDKNPEYVNDPNFKLIQHGRIFWTDTSFQEDISLVSYALNAGHLGLAKHERAKWLAEYMMIEEKNLRLEKLRSLHFNALNTNATIPLFAAPYTALIRKPWKMQFSQLYGNNQFWRITYED